MNTEPAGAETGVEEMLERVWAAMRENEENVNEIVRLSEVSFRLWVDHLAERVSAALGISLGHVKAFFADVGSIARRAGQTFSTSFHDTYEKARKVPPADHRPRRARR